MSLIITVFKSLIVYCPGYGSVPVGNGLLETTTLSSLVETSSGEELTET